ncbi:MAG: tetratricopeptide repeat protein [Vicinamibacterales bacterium]
MRRLLAGVVLLGIAAAAVYGYTVARRERLYGRYLADGDAAMARSDTSAAIEDFSGAIALKSDGMAPYLKRGEAYRRRGEYDAALRDLARAVDLDPTATRPREALGDADLALQRYAQAATEYREYLKLDPPAPRVLYKLAFARYHDARLPEAIDALQKAIAIDDRLPEAYYLLGLCQRDAQHTDAARRALEQSIALQPTLLHAREELADLYGSIGRVDDRLIELEAIDALDPGPSRDVALGLAYARAGETDRAVLTLGRTATRYPAYAYTYVALGRVWLEIAQRRTDRVALSKALGALEGAVGSDNSSEALMLFGRGLLMTGDAESAERMLQDATEKSPIDPLAFYYLAEAAERLGHLAAARDALVDYDALEGGSANAVRIADLSLKLGDFYGAADGFLRAAAAGKGDAVLLVRAADAEWRAGEHDAARATLDKALATDPRNAVGLALKRGLDRQSARSR